MTQHTMNAERAAYFLRRFKHEEKMLGPNEQAALDFAIAALSQPTQATQPVQAPDLVTKLRAALTLAGSYIATRCGTPDPSDPYADQILIAVQQQIETALATPPQAAPVQRCQLCGEDEPFTGTCGGGRNNSRALCYDQAASPAEAVALQKRVDVWLLACFGETIARDKAERNHRFLEEALELVQACGCTASEAHQLVDYTFGRPIGEAPQEVGGVVITLAALCLAQGIDMDQAGEIELARIWTKVEQIRAKQAAKPKHSPLPAAAPASLVGEMPPLPEPAIRAAPVGQEKWPYPTVGYYTAAQMHAYRAAAPQAQPQAAPHPARKATPAMIAAGAEAARRYMQETGGNSPGVIWEAMWDAGLASQPQAEQEAVRFDGVDDTLPVMRAKEAQDKDWRARGGFFQRFNGDDHACIPLAAYRALAAQPQAAARLTGLRRVVADDAYAITFQTLGQYRTALLRAIDRAVSPAAPEQQGGVDA